MISGRYSSYLTSMSISSGVAVADISQIPVKKSLRNTLVRISESNVPGHFLHDRYTAHGGTIRQP